MQTSYQPSGIYSAQWIPTDASGQIDRPSLAAHLAFEKEKGIAGVLGLGSTGEFPFMTVDERKQVLETLAELAAPLPVMANITDIRPAAAIELGRFARSIGLPAVAIMPPVFYPVSQADMLAYFLTVAEGVDLPVMLYNFPELTGKRIDIETVAAFADRAPMCAIKQSGGEFAYHAPLIALGREKHFAVMSGADTRLADVFRMGGAGCIGGLVNIVPELMVQLYQVVAKGQPGDISETAARMVQVGKLVDRLTFPVNVGAGLVARGFSAGAPKSVISPASRAVYETIVRDLGACIDAWGLDRPALVEA